MGLCRNTESVMFYALAMKPSPWNVSLANGEIRRDRLADVTGKSLSDSEEMDDGITLPHNT